MDLLHLLNSPIDQIAYLGKACALAWEHLHLFVAYIPAIAGLAFCMVEARV